MSETTTSDAVLARLEALEAPTAEIAELRAEIAALKGENARLTAALDTPAAVPAPAPTTTSRRGMLRRVLGASAAAALLLVAKEARPAAASYRGTFIVGSASTDLCGGARRLRSVHLARQCHGC